METLIRKYRNKELYDLNCSESILYSANEYYNLNLSKNALSMMSGFGGGVYEKHLCGVVSGSVAVLGILFNGKVSNGTDLLKTAVNEFKQEFRKHYEEIDCQFLTDNYSTEEDGCNPMIFKAAEILKEVVSNVKLNALLK